MRKRLLLCSFFCSIAITSPDIRTEGLWRKCILFRVLTTSKYLYKIYCNMLVQEITRTLKSMETALRRFSIKVPIHIVV